MTSVAIMRFGAATALIAVVSGGAGAQAPQRTTATYEDWTVRCETRGTPAVKSCEMVQAVTAQGQASPVTQIAIGRANKGDPIKVVFQLPINIWIPAGVTFVYDAKEPALPATYRWCVPAGCFADIDLKDDLVKKLRVRTLPGRFEFKDAGQRPVAIPISFKGFGQAFDALAKE